MLAASTLQKRIVSIRDQVRHMGSGQLPHQDILQPWYPGLTCKHTTWHKGKPGLTSLTKEPTSSPHLSPAALTKQKYLVSPTLSRLCLWRASVRNTQGAHVLRPRGKCTCQAGIACSSVCKEMQGWALPSFHSQNWHSWSYQYASIGVNSRCVQKYHMSMGNTTPFQRLTMNSQQIICTRRYYFHQEWEEAIWLPPKSSQNFFKLKSPKWKHPSSFPLWEELWYTVKNKGFGF